MSQGSANPNISTQNSNSVRSIFSADYTAADEGSFFTSWIAAQASTALALTTQALAQANPLVMIFNGQPVGGYNIYMRSIKARITTANTGLTTIEQVGTLNSSAAAYTSGGVLMSGPLNVNAASGTTSRASVYAGPIVAAVPGAMSRVVHTGPVTAIIPIVLDAWNFTFGEVASGSNNAIGTTGATTTCSLPPVIIAPQWWYSFGVWGASSASAAASYRLDVGFIERPSGQ